MSIPSPANQIPIKLQDADVGYSYIEFPADTFFMESLAQNELFRAGVAYIPVQRYVNGQEESHLYEIKPSYTHAKHVAGPIAAPDGCTDVTIFGSALSSDGILYLCAFDRNSVLVLDLKTAILSSSSSNNNNGEDENAGQPVKCGLEIANLSAPNDLCLDPNDESVLYVVCGTFRKCGGCCFTFSDAAYGQILKVELGSSSSKPRNHNHQDKVDPIVSVVIDNLMTLAGVEMRYGKLWVSQLYNIITLDEQQSGATTTKPTEVWNGLDSNEQFWLADNVDYFDDKMLCVAYSTAPAAAVNHVLSQSFISSRLNLIVQAVTACMQGERLRTALQDPEVSLSFSNTYIRKNVAPAPIRLIFLNPTADAQPVAHHFEIDLVQTRAQHPPHAIRSREGDRILGERHFFNEQVTHAAHFKDAENDRGYVACVNFEEPRILLLDDRVFRDAMIPKD